MNPFHSFFDAENKLRTAVKSGTTATYAYDVLGRRQAKTVNGVSTYFLSDGSEEIAEMDGAGVLLRRFVAGPGTVMPIAMVTPGGGGNAGLYVHANRQGSVVAMSNDSGALAEGPYTYDPYGNGAPASGTRPLALARGVRRSNRHCRWRFAGADAPSRAHPFKYTGRRLDPETGLYYTLARYYSSALGRFLQTDPIGYGDQMNLYAYVGNDPMNATDPTGEFAFLIPLIPYAAGAAIGAVAEAATIVAEGGDLTDSASLLRVGGAAVGGAIGVGVGSFVAGRVINTAGATIIRAVSVDAKIRVKAAATLANAAAPVIGGAAGAVSQDAVKAGTRAIAGTGDASFNPVESAKQGAVYGGVVRAAGATQRAITGKISPGDPATTAKLANGAARNGAILRETVNAGTQLKKSIDKRANLGLEYPYDK